MAVFFTEEIIETAGGTVLNNIEYDFSGISTDTRTLKPGNLFIALCGERFDGHNFVAQAVQKGASGVVVSRKIDFLENLFVLQVADTLKALQSIARFHRLRFNIPVVAITGSNGKTTTKKMLAAALAEQFSVLKTEANYNNEIGLPLTLLQFEEKHEAAIVEMGMRGLGEIRELTNIALPTIGVVTNIGETHIELLGSLENIAKAKGELVAGLGQSGLAVLNIDNSFLAEMALKRRAKTLTFAVERLADVSVSGYKQVKQGISFEYCYADQKQEVFLPAFGKHNIYNALAAITVGICLGLSHSQISRGLSNFVPEKMRLNVENYQDYTFINDAYNASPLSMTAALETLQEIAAGRKLCVLGDMLELGIKSEEAHRNVGRQLKSAGVSVVITVGFLAGFIAEAAREQGICAIGFTDHDLACQELRRHIQIGDTILIKGSRGMQMEKIFELFCR